MTRLLLALLLSASLHAAGPSMVSFDAQVVDWNRRALTNNFYLQPELTWSLIAQSAFMGSVRASGLYPGGHLLRVNLMCGRSYGGLNGAGTCTNVGCVELGGPQLPLIADTGPGRDVAVTLQGYWKYVETGSGGGLGEQSTNNPVYLDTGVIPNNVSAWLNDVHLCVYMMNEISNSVAIGVFEGGANIAELVPSNNQASLLWGTVGFPSSADTQGTGLYLGTRVDGTATGLTQYRNGVLTATSTSASGAATLTHSIYMGARNDSGTATNPTRGLWGGYGMGRALTQAQITAYYNAWQMFETLLSRQK